uniref:Uncharacterized protein n=1 Tax=Fusarium oxysporum (strain Fo5176) TaxID=660025 RepID=A0A0D2Y5X2_FUSOF
MVCVFGHSFSADQLLRHLSHIPLLLPCNKGAGFRPLDVTLSRVVYAICCLRRTSCDFYHGICWRIYCFPARNVGCS